MRACIHCVAVCCRVLQCVTATYIHTYKTHPRLWRACIYCVAVCCSVVHSVAVCGSVSQLLTCAQTQHILDHGGQASWCSVLQCVVATYIHTYSKHTRSWRANIVLQCVCSRCSVLQCVAVCCNVLQCVAVWYGCLYTHIQNTHQIMEGLIFSPVTFKGWRCSL